jgi:lipopolysaccharide transport system permease protein
MKNDKIQKFEIHIHRRTGLFAFDLAELNRYRDLLILLLYRDFSSRFKQTILGPAWFVIQPLLTTVVFTVIFGRVAKMPTDGLPPLLFYLAGLLGWNYHATVLQATGNTFQTNANLFGKVYFPRLIVPLAATISQLIGWAIQFATFLVFFFYYFFFTSFGEQLSLSWTMLLFPLLIVQAGMIGLGSGFWLSALTAKYRDLQHLQTFLVQTWMYITPLVYPLSMIPDKWRWVAILNPMTMVIEGIKSCMLGSGSFTLSYYLISLGTTLVLFISGLTIFEKVERTFVDTV